MFHTYVLLRMVPDVVEELAVAEDGRSLESQWLRMILSECCDHALEQALLFKEKHGGAVTALAVEAPQADEALHVALAKGADRAVMLQSEKGDGGSPLCAALFADWLERQAGTPTDQTVILTGSQCIDDLEGEIGPTLADMLHLPYLGVVTGMTWNESERNLTARKEYSGGIQGEWSVALPAVLGIQSAEKPPRYVPVAKIRAVMKASRIETVAPPPVAPPAALVIDRLAKPEESGRAQMIEGDAQAIAKQLAEVLAGRGLF